MITVARVPSAEMPMPSSLTGEVQVSTARRSAMPSGRTEPGGRKRLPESPLAVKVTPMPPTPAPLVVCTRAASGREHRCVLGLLPVPGDNADADRGGGAHRRREDRAVPAAGGGLMFRA